MSEQGVAADPFAGIDCVVKDDLLFKKKLGVGADAFTSITVAEMAKNLAAAGSAATAGATVAGSATVAGTFFASTSWLGVIGLGAAAATPVGVVIGAAVLTGGAYFGAVRLMDRYRESRVDTIPRFLNSNIDVLGAAIVDALGSIVIRIAASDGAICEAERAHLRDYFVEAWGIDPDYARVAVAALEQGIPEQPLKECMLKLADAARAHPDCPAETLRQRLFELIEEMVKADGRVCDGERAAVADVRRLVASADPSGPAAYATAWWGALTARLST